jgi:predicted RNA-binding protein with PUA-like domain
MNYWLMKSEPNTFSWDDLVSRKVEPWDGVRNYQARNNLKEMKKGDLALFYHSVKEKSVVGIAEIVKEYYQDPTTDNPNWVVVEVKPISKLPNPVTLEKIKNDTRLDQMVLVKNSRLSVQPVKKEEFDLIISMGQ